MPACPELFCGCEVLTSFYSTQNTNKISFVLSIGYIILITMITLTINLKWFVYKDYYPLKQRSPILSMMLSVALCLNLLIYPILYVYNFLTFNFNDDLYLRVFFRAFHSAIQFAPYLLYFVRAMRIVYAHKCTIKHKNTKIFKMFKYEAFLGIIIFVFCLLRALPIIFDPYEDYIKHFKLMVEMSAARIDPMEEIPYLYRYLSTSFCMKLLLLYCLYMQKYVHHRYTMKLQLVFIIVTQILASVPIVWFSIFEQYREISILYSMCFQTEIYPPSEIIKSVRLACLIIISLVYPLKKKRIYHKFLPTPRIHGFVKTMRDFLMENTNLKIFSEFLKHLDEKYETKANSSLLAFWKQLIIIRYKEDADQNEKIQKLRNLMIENEDMMFEEERQLMIQLKSSIDDLYEELESSGIVSEKCHEELNQRVKQLQKIVLTKLDRIYWKQYTETQSYYNLSRIAYKNKNTNLNMIMLNMTLIVDSMGEFE